MKGQFAVDIAVMRATIRWMKGECGRREVRQAMLRDGWTEPSVSNYLDMAQRAMRQVAAVSTFTSSPKARKEIR
jgi:hypothetical protein